MLRRAFAVVTVALAALALAGCFVVAKNVPAGSGPVDDERLVGTWRGIEGQNEEGDAFLHFQRTEQGQPLRLVWVENNKYHLYDVISRRIGNKNVFAARMTGPAEALKEKDATTHFFIGFYDFKSPSELEFSPLDSQKIGRLIEQHKLKGERPPGQYSMATLTGSPHELARFLASPEAAAAVIEEPARLRRLTASK